MALSDRVVVMSRGRIEQIGPPFDIYNYPGTPFVAAFVGQLNHLEGRVVDPAAGTVAVGTSTLRTTGEIEAGSGERVTLMVRPEELEVGAHEENRVSGIVDTVNFLGAIVRVRVDTDSGPITADLFNERLLELPKVGDEVTVSFPAHACWVMKTR